MQSKATTVAAYLKALPDGRRKALSKLRSLIRKVAPGVKETMEYGMPFYDLKGPLFALGAQKHHLALYICETDLVAAYRPRLGKLSVGKSCIRFKRLDQLPLDVIEELLRDTVQERRWKVG